MLIVYESTRYKIRFTQKYRIPWHTELVYAHICYRKRLVLKIFAPPGMGGLKRSNYQTDQNFCSYLVHVVVEVAVIFIQLKPILEYFVETGAR